MSDLSRFFDELALATVFNIDTAHRTPATGSNMRAVGKVAERTTIRHAERLLPLLPATRALMVAATKLDASQVSRAMGMLRRAGKVELVRGVWRERKDGSSVG